ncbi:MAG: presenilin family intramembrane aspartyl protease [Candidatus Micrarchaeota archaeon]|nr:presenilin family intramembrane aspartyl protease [Candidatus Micrarchaeota archaeon]
MFSVRLVPALVLTSFVFTQFLALVVGYSFIAQGLTVVENPSDVGNSLFFFAYIVAAAVFILVVLKFYKGKRLFLVLELLLIFFSFQMLSSMVTGDWVYQLIISALAVGVRLKAPAAKNVLLLFVTAAVGALLGASLDVLPAVVLAVLLAGYDVVAVFFTGHMITLAKQLDKREAAFSVDVKVKKESMQLGTGDLVIPAVLAVSALKISYGAAISVVVGATAGMIVLIYILQHRRGYLPALPPIIGFALVGLGAWLFLP